MFKRFELYSRWVPLLADSVASWQLGLLLLFSPFGKQKCTMAE